MNKHKKIISKNTKNHFKISLNSNIREIVETVPGATEIFSEYGLPCAGCIAASYESLIDVVNEFGIDGQKLVSVLQKAMNLSKKT